MELVICSWNSSFVSKRTRSGIMARWRYAIELALTEEEIERLGAIARSRSTPAACRGFFIR